MKKTIVTTLGALALLGSAASMAATVSVVPSTGITTPCCTATVPSGNFFVTLHVADMPGDGTNTGSTGASLTINFDPAIVNVTGAALSPGSPLDFITPLTPNGPGSVKVSALRNAAGYAVGTFDAFQINFATIANGVANIVVFDDGADNAWTDQDAASIPMSYNQANVCVNSCGGPPIPVPAAVWMLVSALGSLAGIKRLRRV